MRSIKKKPSKHCTDFLTYKSTTKAQNDQNYGVWLRQNAVTWPLMNFQPNKFQPPYLKCGVQLESALHFS
jgi:hypothetical protein